MALFFLCHWPCPGIGEYATIWLSPASLKFEYELVTMVPVEDRRDVLNDAIGTAQYDLLPMIFLRVSVWGEMEMWNGNFQLVLFADLH